MIKAIVFDLGGVIYRHPKAVIPHVLSTIFNQPVEKIDKEYQKYKNLFFAGKISPEKLLGVLKEKFSIEKTIEELEKEWFDVYGRLAQPDEGIVQLLKDLKRKYKLYLFTNTTEMSDRYNRNTGIYDHFNDAFFSFKTGLVKPDPESYRFLLLQTSLEPEDCLLIDDKEENLKVAKDLGIKTILFDILKEDSEKLQLKLRKMGL